MNNTPSQNEAIQKIRQKLYICAALALRHNLDLSAELFRIFVSEAPATPQSMIETKIETKGAIGKFKLEGRDLLVFETIYTAAEPISIDEMLDKFKGNRDTRCSKTTLTTTVKVLRALELISYTEENGKFGYLRKQSNGAFDS